MKSDPLINRARGGAAQILRGLVTLPRERRLAALNEQLARIDRAAPARLAAEVRLLAQQGYEAESAVTEGLARVLADRLLGGGPPTPISGLGQVDPGTTVTDVLRGIACAPGVASFVAETATRSSPEMRSSVESSWASAANASGMCVGVTPPPPTPPPPLSPSRQSGPDVFTPVAISVGILVLAGVAAFAFNPR